MTKTKMATGRKTLDAPVHVVEVIDPQYQRLSGFDPFKDVEGDLTKCHFCGHNLAWRVVVQDSKGKKAVLGMDCAKKTYGVRQGALSHAQNRAEARTAAAKLLLEIRQDLESLLKEHQDSLEKHSHPSPKHANLNLTNYVEYWLTAETSDTAKLRHALALARKTIGVRPMHVVTAELEIRTKIEATKQMIDFWGKKLLEAKAAGDEDGKDHCWSSLARYGRELTDLEAQLTRALDTWL